MKLLIVDDSNLIRTRIASCSQDARLPSLYVVGLARNGVEALHLAAQHRPDAVTLDLTMPEMDGIACVEALMRFDPAVRVLVVSALSDKATAIRALKLGAQGFLHKPFTDEQLILALRELLRQDRP